MTGKPHITASGITMAAYGDSVTLECGVDAHPEPKMLFWRDYANRVPVIQGSKYDVSIVPAKDVSSHLQGAEDLTLFFFEGAIVANSKHV